MPTLSFCKRAHEGSVAWCMLLKCGGRGGWVALESHSTVRRLVQPDREKAMTHSHRNVPDPYFEPAIGLVHGRKFAVTF